MIVTQESGIRPQIFSAIAASLVIVSCGFHYAWPTVSAYQLLDNDIYSPNVTYGQVLQMSDLIYVGGVIGALLSVFFVDTFGRRATLLVSTLPFVASGGLIAGATKFGWFYAARFMAGLGIGVALTVTPMYIGEITETRLRGGLCALIPVTMRIGDIFLNAIGWSVDVSTTGKIGAAIAIAAGIGIICIYESPYYYAMKNKPDEVLQVVNKLRGASDVAQEVDQIQNNVGFIAKDTGKFRDLFTVSGNRKAFAVIMGLITCQNLSGWSAMYLLVEQSFRYLNLDISPLDRPIVVGLAFLLPAFVIVLMVDRFERRPLLMISTSFSAAFLILGAVWYVLLKNGLYIEELSWVPAASVLGFLISNTMGLGTIPVLMSGELFSCKVKGLALSICTAYSIGGLWVSCKLWESMRSTEFYGVLLLIATFNIAAVIFIRLVVPETKGKSLNEIQTIFHQGFQTLL